MKRKALGKGLGALIPAAIGSSAAKEGLLWVDLDRIMTNPRQPRKRFGEEGLEALARSIRDHGMLQPILIRRELKGYQLVAGERRWRAAQKAGLRKVPAILRDTTDDRVLEVALVENLQREDLNPVEEAKAYEWLVKELNLTQEEVASRVGRQRATVANSLRILKLPEEVQEIIRRDQLSAGHAKVLSGMEDAAEQIRVARLAQRRGLSVRALERLVARDSKAKAPARSKENPCLDPNTVRAVQNLKRALGTQVRIERRAKGGSLIVEFYDEEDLHRLYTLLLAAARSSHTGAKGGLE
ncbi:MAG: ParB/RepB/Spo0J family partition protein [Acidobacteriota bacterium]